MTDKISCPTLNVVLTKAIRALCEVTIKFDHTLEITGSLHVRSDGDKVLTCLLNEDCIKSSASHLNDVALKLSLVNAALALNNISIVQNSIIKANEAGTVPQVARNVCSFEAASSRSVAPQAVDCLMSSSAAHGYSFGGGHASTALPDDNNNNFKLGTKSSRGSGPRCRKKVETVARTLANIKTASHALSDRSMDFNPMEMNIATVKLPDIQTLAHRLPSYKAATNEGEGHMVQSAKVNVHSPSPSALVMVPIKHAAESIKKETGEEELDLKISNQKGQQRVKKFQCMFCGIFLSTKCYLKNHVNAMHTRLHVYKCDLCEHSFYSAGAMRIHKLRNHWHDSKKHRCSECNESFLLPIELRKHMQKRHHLQPTSTAGTNTTVTVFTSRQQHHSSVASYPVVSAGTNKRGAVNLSIHGNPPADSKSPDAVEQMKVEPGEFSQPPKKVPSSASPSFSVRNGVSSDNI